MVIFPYDGVSNTQVVARMKPPGTQYKMPSPAYYGFVPSDVFDVFVTTETKPPDTQYEMPDEVLRWQPPICFICKERKYCYISLPYGSDYDGDIICGDCCHKYFDPVIAAVRSGKDAE